MVLPWSASFFPSFWPPRPSCRSPLSPLLSAPGPLPPLREHSGRPVGRPRCPRSPHPAVVPQSRRWVSSTGCARSTRAFPAADGCPAVRASLAPVGNPTGAHTRGERGTGRHGCGRRRPSRSRGGQVGHHGCRRTRPARRHRGEPGLSGEPRDDPAAAPGRLSRLRAGDVRVAPARRGRRRAVRVPAGDVGGRHLAGDLLRHGMHRCRRRDHRAPGPDRLRRQLRRDHGGRRRAPRTRAGTPSTSS